MVILAESKSDPWAINSTSLGGRIYGHHSHAFRFSQIYMGAEKIFSKFIHFYCMVIFAPHQIQNPYPQGHEFHNLGRELHRHNSHVLIHMGVEKKLF